MATLSSIGRDGIVIYGEDGKFYALPRTTTKNTGWKDIAVHLDSPGDARVLIKRGAVVAGIPKPRPPRGTFCVLLNLKSILKGTAR